MAISEVLDVIWKWVDQVINQEELLELEVIFGSQNAPAPDGEYILINRPFAFQKIGRGNWQMSEETGEEDQMNYTIHYQCTISIEDVLGGGDVLRLLINSLNRQDIKDYFTESLVSVMKTETITPSNLQMGEFWELRSVLDLIIQFSDCGSYEAGYIETVDFTGTYEGTQN